jgi:hypothetical protein
MMETPDFSGVFYVLPESPAAQSSESRAGLQAPNASALK